MLFDSYSIKRIMLKFHLLIVLLEIMILSGTKAGDVYSFGIICHEVLECSGPFNTRHDHGLDAESEYCFINSILV